jgi:hypothetical protein
LNQRTKVSEPILIFFLVCPCTCFPNKHILLRVFSCLKLLRSPSELEMKAYATRRNGSTTALQVIHSLAYPINY